MASGVGWKMSSMLVWKKGIKRRVKKRRRLMKSGAVLNAHTDDRWRHREKGDSIGTSHRFTDLSNVVSATAPALLHLLISCQIFFLVFSIGAEMLVWLCTNRAIKHPIWELTLNVGCAYKKKETFSTLDGCILPAEKTAFQVCWSPGTHLYQ